MENESVRFSRAGDEFHYRWAARRCLKLIYPQSPLQYIVIEGSGTEEQELAGEYVIDVTEYSHSLDDTTRQIAYYQLKHTTARKNEPFNLSDLKNTILYDFPGSGHALITSGDCAVDLITQFYDNPLTAPNGRCLDEIEWPYLMLSNWLRAAAVCPW